MAERERIAVTGLGLVTALGIGRELTFSRLCAGERGVDSVGSFDTEGLKSRIAAEVPGLDVAAIAPPGEAGDWSRSDALAFIAAREALSHARLEPSARLGLALGGTTGGMYETERALSRISPGALQPEHARRLLDFPLAVTVERLSRALGGIEQSGTVCSACSSGAVAIALGASWLSSGRAESVLAGGVDGLCQLTFTGFNALGAVDPAPCRPFDAARAGLTLGEGAGFLVLELESRARARGAPIIAFLSGWAVASEAHHVTHPEPTGTRAAAVIRHALQVAQLTPADIDYVNAHGTGTAQNDAMEARALLLSLGAEAQRIWLSSSKAQIGHTLGAAGAIEAAITALSVERGRLPPMVGLEQPEFPELNFVREPNQSVPLRAALSSSFGFGGACAVLAFEAPTAEPRVRTFPEPSALVISGAARYDAAPDVDPLTLLQAERSRRFGRASAIVVATGERALRDAALGPEGVGFVVGSAFGDVERSVRFLQKVLNQGSRAAGPAEFPQLIASTGSGNASLYLGLTGPCLSVSEFSTSGESAVSVAIALIELGEATAIIAGAAEARDSIVESVLGSPRGAARSEGGGFVVVETLQAALARGHSPRAVLAEHRALRGDASEALTELRAPAARACVITGLLPSAVAGALARSAWRDVAIESLPATLGYHEAIGAAALATAVARLAEGAADEALVVTASVNVVYLSRLQRYEARP